MSASASRTPDDAATGGRARPSRWWGSLAAVVAAAAALGVAELVAGLVRSATSPVLSVGEWVIDHSPSWLKEFAVSRFGTSDKLLLIAGTVVLLTLFAIGIGWLAARHRATGVAGIAVFGLIGAATALSRPSATASAALPALLGSAVAAAVLVVLLGRLEPAPPAGTTGSFRGEPVPAGALRPSASTPVPAPIPSASGPAVMTPTRIPAAVGPVPAGFDRRRFLASAVAVGGGTVVVAGTGRWLQRRFDVDSSRATLRLPTPGSPAVALPPGVDLGAAGVTPFMTTNADFYRVDTALQAPQVATEGWALRLDGMVDRPLTLTFEDLLDRPLVERTITLVCVSNEVGGSYAGTARWLGVPLADLLQQAGIQPASTQLVSRSVDGWTAGTPTAAVLDGRDALVAIGMNGEPLPVEHGFPARLVVPGLYGFTSANQVAHRDRGHHLRGLRRLLGATGMGPTGAHQDLHPHRHAARAGHHPGRAHRHRWGGVGRPPGHRAGRGAHRRRAVADGETR